MFQPLHSSGSPSEFELHGNVASPVGPVATAFPSERQTLQQRANTPATNLGLKNVSTCMIQLNCDPIEFDFMH